MKPHIYMLGLIHPLQTSTGPIEESAQQTRSMVKQSSACFDYCSMRLRKKLTRLGG